MKNWKVTFADALAVYEKTTQARSAQEAAVKVLEKSGLFNFEPVTVFGGRGSREMTIYFVNRFEPRCTVSTIIERCK